MELRVIGSTERQDFLWNHYNDSLLDRRVFDAAKVLLKDYQGGCWEYVETDYGAAFLRPPEQETYTLIQPRNFLELEVDATLAGMVITYCVLLGRLQMGLIQTSPSYINLKIALANYCLELERADVLKALLS
jgi:hypothetical protein